jgi:acyl dehydratase
MADKSFIGKEFPAFTWEVERGKIRELATAIGDDNPIYVDSEAAVKEGYEDVVAPPTFITAVNFWSEIGKRVNAAAGINFSRVLHGGETYEYFKEIYPGDVLKGVTKIVSIETKPGKSGDMEIITRETLYTNQKDELVLKATTVAVERK